MGNKIVLEVYSLEDKIPYTGEECLIRIDGDKSFSIATFHDIKEPYFNIGKSRVEINHVKYWTPNRI